MNPKKIIKKTIKKAASPLAKKVYSVADNVNNIKTEPINAQIAALKDQIKELENNNSMLAATLGDFESKSHYIYYYHGGAGNHGCEALVRTISDICDIPSEELGIYSYRPEQDRIFGVLDRVNYIKKSYLDTREMLDHYRPGTLALSIGGDNYCGYPIPQLAKYNRRFHEGGAKTALIGCSIEPSNLEHGEILGDLCQFDLITARESITYKALLEKGINKNTHLIPDSAFILQPQPSGITLPNNTVGFNISSIVSIEAGTSAIMQNSIELISYILKETNYNVALIPHVNQDFNDDYAALKTLYEHFNKDSRIILINTMFNACQLKDIVGQCSMLVTARTHCSIAGYSMAVPTLVLGYSVKSHGIATDLFGTDEHYVQSVQELKTNHDFVDAFKWLDKNKVAIKKHLTKILPSYTKNIPDLKKLIRLTPKEPKVVQPKLPASKQYQKGILSIITSCYNSEKYLYRYLNSILNQTNHNIELVIVNDGSTDNTEKIILDYKPVLEKQNIKLVYLKQQNGGIGAAYNLAMKYVSGEFFSWCDSDNFYSPNYVETVLGFFKKHSDAKILRHDGYFVPEEESEAVDIFDRIFPKKFSDNSPNPHEKRLFFNSILEKNWHFGNIVLNTKAFDEVSERSFYPSRNGQNWQLCLPMLYNYDAYYIPDVLFYFVVRQASESHQNIGNNEALFKQYDGYHEILSNTLHAMNIKEKDKKMLDTIIEQKYISIKYEIAKQTNDTNNIEKYKKEFEEKVSPNNLYQKALNDIK